MKETASQQSVRPEWLEPSDAYGWKVVSRNVISLLFVLWLAPTLIEINSGALLALVPVVGALMYRLTIVMHDCVHRTLFKNRGVNEGIGMALGALTGVDFRCFANEHWRHHGNFGATDDPQGHHYLGLRHMSRRQFRWHLFKPLLGLNLRRTLAASLLHPRNLRRNLLSPYIVVVLSAQFILSCLATGFGAHPLLALLPSAASATFGLWLSQLRGIAEHGVLAAGNEVGFMRSHRSNWLDRILLYDLNFNYHMEHHENPHVPSCHLAKVHCALQRDTGTTPRSMLATLCDMDLSLGKAHG